MTENEVDEQKEGEPAKKRRGRPKKTDNNELAARKTKSEAHPRCENL